MKLPENLGKETIFFFFILSVHKFPLCWFMFLRLFRVWCCKGEYNLGQNIMMIDAIDII